MYILWALKDKKFLHIDENGTVSVKLFCTVVSEKERLEVQRISCYHDVLF